MMSKYIKLNYSVFAAWICMIFSCTPDKQPYVDNPLVDINRVDSISLVPNHKYVYGDGNATLDLRPEFFIFEKSGKRFKVADERISMDMLDYRLSTGEEVSRYFSTSDPQLYGKTLEVQLKLKNRELLSDKVSFTVLAPTVPAQEITIPVIFHVVQTTDDVNIYGGSFDGNKIAALLHKINNSFAAVSQNPVGINTKITFKAALYDPLGNRLVEPGINRMVSNTIDPGAKGNSYSQYLADNKLVWSHDDYLNIWLMSDRTSTVERYFGPAISAKCLPKYYDNANTADVPLGLKLTKYDKNTAVHTPYNTGVIYKIQNVNAVSRSLGSNLATMGDNELVYYIGSYFGLLPTFKFYVNNTPISTDYCEDTMDYFVNYTISKNLNNNLFKYYNGYYFEAGNIMDDPSGVHTSISKDQYERMLWLLNHSPERSAWKSDFAFTGKK